MTWIAEVASHADPWQHLAVMLIYEAWEKGRRDDGPRRRKESAVHECSHNIRAHRKVSGVTKIDEPGVAYTASLFGG